MVSILFGLNVLKVWYALVNCNPAVWSLACPLTIELYLLALRGSSGTLHDCGHRLHLLIRVWNKTHTQVFYVNKNRKIFNHEYHAIGHCYLTHYLLLDGGWRCITGGGALLVGHGLSTTRFWVVNYMLPVKPHGINRSGVIRFIITYSSVGKKLSCFIRHLSDGLYIFYINLPNLPSDIWP